MGQLAETNCEISEIINLKLPPWKPSNNQSQENAAALDGFKESNVNQINGGFLNNDYNYAWLSNDSVLIVMDVIKGNCLSIWKFPDKITSVSAFPAQLGCVPLLLIGLDNNAIKIKDSIGHLCIFNCLTCNILTTIQVPAGVERATVVHGGAKWERFNKKRPDTVLPGNSGLIFAALRNLQHVIIDINRDLWEKSCFERKPTTATLEFVNLSNTKQNNKSNKIELTHLAYDLIGEEIEQYIGFDRKEFESTPLYEENLCSVLLSSTKTGCLITGCLGRVIIWQQDGSIGWISPTFDENAYVTHLALLEPSDDPKPFYYLWIVCQSDVPDSAAVLRMYMLVFKKKFNDRSSDGSSLYFDLESEPSLKFEVELEQGERVHSLLAIERGNSRDGSDLISRRGEESLLLVGTEERVLLFDLNRWYKEQMPCTLSGCRNPNSVMASYRTQQQNEEEPRKNSISSCYIHRSLREFPKAPNSPEELFFPNSLNFEWVDLTEDGLVFWLTRGVQSELLREITMAGPIVLVVPNETYRRCLKAGLVPFDTNPQDYNLNAEPTIARNMLLSLCLEQRRANFLLRCANEWSDGSAANLYLEFLRWGVQRASEIKLSADHVCVSLFDQSGNNIGDSEVRTLRCYIQQLECLATVVSRIQNPENDLVKHKRALKRIAAYLQVLIWFHDVGLLPEILEYDIDNDDDVNMSLLAKIPYPRNKLSECFKRKRRNDGHEENDVDDILFIDQFITRECLPIKNQWDKESDCDSMNQNGLYPPPSLQSLLRIFLTDCYREIDDDNNEDDEDCELPETLNKHCIVLYLLLDLAEILEGTSEAIDQLIKYPSAFKLSPSLIKLTQAFWYLDHGYFQRFFKIMSSQLVSNSDIKDWQHQLAINALLKNEQHKLALVYLQIVKPPLSSLNEQSLLIDLAVEQDLIESAFHARPPSHYGQLLLRFFQSCKNNGKLNRILRLSLNPEEEEVFVKYLKDNDCEETRLLYYLQRGRQTEVSDLFTMNANVHPSLFTEQQKKIQPGALNLLQSFNNTLPEITKRFANSNSKNPTTPIDKSRPFVPLSMMNNSNGSQESYPKPMSLTMNRTNDIYEMAMLKTRETCLRSGTSNYIPFLVAPFTTVNFGPKYAGQSSNEQNDLNQSIIYPEKRTATKRTRRMSGVEEKSEYESESKRRKLEESDLDSSNNSGDSKSFHRLSMSHVCNTPLVQRKEIIESTSLASETPHSILKIRQQMICRDSRSPSLNYSQGGASDKQSLYRRSISGDSRPLRQLRFSVDRLSKTDDSGLSANETENEDDDSGSSKNIKEDLSIDENYKSINLTEKSIRNQTILSENSMTRNLTRPRPRPIPLKDDSDTSSESSEEQSFKCNTFLDSTSIISDQNVFNESITSISNVSKRTSKSSSSIYSKPILSPNSSNENLKSKGPFTICNINRNKSNKSEESNDETEDDSNVFKFSDAESYQEFSTEISLSKDKENCNTIKDQSDCEIKIDQNEYFKEPNSIRDVDREQFQTPTKENEDSDDDDNDEDDANESFQSISNSFDEQYKILTNITLSGDNVELVKELERLKKNSRHKHSLMEQSPDQTKESSDYNLIKPIFSVDQDNVTDEESNVTDDENNMENESHADFKILEEDKNKTQLTGLDAEKRDKLESFINKEREDLEIKEKIDKVKSLDKKEKSIEIEIEKERLLVSQESNSPPRITRNRSNQSSQSSLKSDSDKSDDSSQKRSSLEEIRKVSPRRSIRSMSTIPKIQIDKSLLNNSTDQDKDGEIKVITTVPKIVIDDCTLQSKKEDSNKLSLPENSFLKPIDDEEKEATEPIVKKRTRGLKKEIKSLDSTELDSKVSTRNRTKRSESVAKDTSPKKSTRKTRGTSVTKESLEATITNEVVGKKSTKIRLTRSSSIAKDTSSIITGIKTRASSIAKDDEQLLATPTSRKTRASSQAKDSSISERKITRASSVAKDNEVQNLIEKSPGRKRGGSVAKDNEDVIEKSPSRKRGGSVAKEIPNILEVTRPQRSRRANSLLKEVIVEEKSSFTESSVSPNRTRTGRLVTSSRAANSRGRRCSVQSVPDDIQELLNSTTKSRDRRATSVDSAVIVPEGKRVTRSVLAKAALVADVIAEESLLIAKKQTPKRKCETLSESNVDEVDEKLKTPVRLKRGRKASECKDYEFSLPGKAGEATLSLEKTCTTPTFKFAEPAKLQK